MADGDNNIEQVNIEAIMLPKVFVSYTWRVEKAKEDVWQVVECLRQSGRFRQVWLDKDNMSNDKLSAMEKNIRDSDVVIIFYSPMYINSQDCESEARSARRNKKPIVFVKMHAGDFEIPDWFRLILSDNIYVDFYGKEIEDAMTALFRSIDDCLLQAGTATGVVGATTSVTLSYPSQSQQITVLQQQGRGGLGATRPLTLAEWLSIKLVPLAKDLETAIRKCNVEAVRNVFYDPLMPTGARQKLLESRFDGDDVLNYAAYWGTLEIVQFLVDEQGASVESRGYAGRTPLLNACLEPGNLPKVKFLMEQKKTDREAEDTAGGNKAVHLAASFGDVEMLSYLLEQNPQWLEVKSSKCGRTPLMHACCHPGNLEKVKFLIEQMKADSEVEDGDGGSKAVHLASEFGDVEMLSYLLQLNANWLEVKSCKWGRTPLLHACSVPGNLDKVKFLIEKLNADIDAESSSGRWNALHYAASFGADDIVSYLLKTSSKLASAETRKRCLAIDLAKKKNHFRVVALMETPQSDE